MESSSQNDCQYLAKGANVLKNLSTQELLESVKCGCDGCLKAGENFAVVDSGDIKGRLPDDKYVVTTRYARKNVWWQENGSDNKPLNRDASKNIRQLVCENISLSEHTYIVDGFYNNDDKNRLAVRFVTNIPWAAYFFRLISIEPTAQELQKFEPQWTILHSPATKVTNFKDFEMNSENAVITNLKYRETIIVGTYYLTEITKSMLSAMSYYLSLNNIGVFHCAVGIKDNHSAMFFGLSGSGKSTLSATNGNIPVSTDATSWSNDGVYALEGGYSIKTASYNRENSFIQKALNANVLAENPNFDGDGKVIFGYKTKGQSNTHLYFSRKSVGIDVASSNHPDTIIFLAKDSKGVLPRVSKLTKGQAIYHLLSGYTCTSVGIEDGVEEPQAEFSSCYSQPFLLLEPTRYAQIFRQRLKNYDAKIYLINVGWLGGDYKTGTRASMEETKAIVEYLTSEREDISFYYKRTKYFNLKSIAEIQVGDEVLRLNNRWEDAREYKKQYKSLAKDFIKNYEQFAGDEFAQKYAQFGPTLKS